MYSKNASAGSLMRKSHKRIHAEFITNEWAEIFRNSLENSGNSPGIIQIGVEAVAELFKNENIHESR